MQNPTSLNYRENVEQYYRKHIVDFFYSPTMKILRHMIVTNTLATNYQ